MHERWSIGSAPSGPWRRLTARVRRASSSQGVIAVSSVASCSPCGSSEPATASPCADSKTSSTRSAPLSSVASSTRQGQFVGAAQLVQAQPGVDQALERLAQAGRSGACFALGPRQFLLAGMLQPRQHDLAPFVDLVQRIAAQALVAEAGDDLHDEAIGAHQRVVRRLCGRSTTGRQQGLAVPPPQGLGLHAVEPGQAVRAVQFGGLRLAASALRGCPAASQACARVGRKPSRLPALRSVATPRRRPVRDSAPLRLGALRAARSGRPAHSPRPRSGAPPAHASVARPRPPPRGRRRSGACAPRRRPAPSRC